MKTIPIPVDGEIYEMIRESAKKTGLSMADVMRQGLRWGVPAFTRAISAPQQEYRRPKSLDYVDDYPPADINDVRDMKKVLKEKLRKKYERSNR
jgi:hypothetical protein